MDDPEPLAALIQRNNAIRAAYGIAPLDVPPPAEPPHGEPPRLELVR